MVPTELFDRVQDLLRARNLSKEKIQTYRHYLKGTAFCGRCGSRLSMCRFRGHGGDYDYFYCLGRHRDPGSCDLPYLQVDELEERVAAHWRTRVQLPPAVLEDVRSGLLSELGLEQQQAGKHLQHLRGRIAAIERQRVSWATKSADGVIPDDIGRTKQSELTSKLVRAQSDLKNAENATKSVEDVLSDALDLVRDCGKAYGQADDLLKRDWNQVFFAAIAVDVDRVTDATLREPFDTLLHPKLTERYQRAAPPDRSRGKRQQASRGGLPARIPDPISVGPV